MAEKSIKLNRADTFISIGEEDGSIKIQIESIKVVFNKNITANFEIYYRDFLIYNTIEKLNIAFLTEKVNPIVLENAQNTDKENDKKLLDILDVLASIKSFKDSPYKELEDKFQISFDEIISVFLRIESILKQYITITGFDNTVELIGIINPESKLLESPYFYNSYIPPSSEIELDKKNIPFKNKVVCHLFFEYPQFQNHFEFMKGKYFEETPDGFLEWKKSWVTLPQYFNSIKPKKKKLNNWIVVGEAFKRPAQIIKRDFASNNKTDSRDFIKLKEDFSKNYNPDGI